jgi:predicted nucleotidyltransferase
MTTEFEELLEEIKQEISPDKIILFGSRANNTNSEFSDYDVFVIKNNLINKRQLTQQLYKLLINKSIAVDFIIDDSISFEMNKSNPYMIYKEIATYGKLLYEKL